MCGTLTRRSLVIRLLCGLRACFDSFPRSVGCITKRLRQSTRDKLSKREPRQQPEGLEQE